jgi:hypothetical protein
VNGLTWQQGGIAIMVAGMAIVGFIVVRSLLNALLDGLEILFIAGRALRRARHTRRAIVARVPGGDTRPLSLGDLVISPQQEEAVRQRVKEAYLRRYPADTRADLPVTPGDPLCPWCWRALDRREWPEGRPDHADCTCTDACGALCCCGGWGPE